MRVNPSCLVFLAAFSVLSVSFTFVCFKHTSMCPHCLVLLNFSKLPDFHCYHHLLLSISAAACTAGECLPSHFVQCLESLMLHISVLSLTANLWISESQTLVSTCLCVLCVFCYFWCVHSWTAVKGKSASKCGCAFTSSETFQLPSHSCWLCTMGLSQKKQRITGWCSQID